MIVSSSYSILATPNSSTCCGALEVLFGNFLEAELKDLGDCVGDHESAAEDYGYYSDSDLEGDDEQPASSTLARDESSARPPYRPVGEEPHYEIHNELDNKGKVVRIPDIAFVT